MLLGIFYPVLLDRVDVPLAVLSLVEHRHHHHRRVTSRHALLKLWMPIAAGEQVYYRQEEQSRDRDELEAASP